MTARDALGGMKARLDPALFHAPYVADGRRVVQANNHPDMLPYVLSDNSMPVIAEFIAAAPTDVARLIDAVEAVLGLAENWRYKGEFGWGAWQEGHGPDPEGLVLDSAAAELRAAVENALNPKEAQ